MYVEPRYFERRGDDLLLLGSPTYVWDVGPDRAELAEDRTFFGVRIRGDEVERISNPPVAGTITFVQGLRVAPAHVVFIFDVETTGVDGATVDRQPHVADWVQGSWRDVQPLSPHRGFPIRSAGLVTSLLATGVGSDVHFAVSVGPVGQTVRFVREAGTWRSEAVGVGGAGGLALGGGSGDVMLAEAGWGPIADAPPLLHVSRLSDGSGAAVVLDAPGAEAQTPVWSSDAEAVAVRLVADSAVSLALIEPGKNRAPLLVEGWAQDVVPLPVAGFDASWLMQSRDRFGAAQLTFLALRDGGLTRADTPYPFHGLFRALAPHPSASGPDEITFDLLGPEARFPPQAPFVRSLMIRMSLSCR